MFVQVFIIIKLRTKKKKRGYILVGTLEISSSSLISKQFICKMLSHSTATSTTTRELKGCDFFYYVAQTIQGINYRNFQKIVFFLCRDFILRSHYPNKPIKSKKSSSEFKKCSDSFF